MFNNEYQYSFNQITDLLYFPHGECVVSETPLEADWSQGISSFWEGLISQTSDSFKANLASLIHNMTMRYFLQLLAYTIFCQKNSNKVNVREFFYLFVVFTPA